ncbi:hypothetical protein IH992_24890 [Candidatus Poribacteria bacterium]|nr:hypothetical protein [Candidatus Poribacteria bacterium]
MEVSDSHEVTLYIERVRTDRYDFDANILEDDDQKLLRILDLMGIFVLKSPDVSRYRYGYNSNVGLDRITGKRTVLGARAIVPIHIAEKFMSPSEWVNDIAKSYQQESSRYGRQEDKIPSKIKSLIEEMCNIVQVEGIIGDNALLATDDCPASLFSLDILSGTTRQNCYNVEIFLDSSKQSNIESSKLASRWRGIIQSPVIPFDSTDRQNRLRHAYRELKPFIEAHQAMLREGILY